MPSLLRKQANDQIRYTLTQLIQLRRQMLRFARSLPPGPARNERRQTAGSLRRLFKDRQWLDAHLVEGSTTEYQVNIVDHDGSSHKAIKVDCPDDAAAVDYAKQYIDGKDVELWQNNRKVVEFERKPE